MKLKLILKVALIVIAVLLLASIVILYNANKKLNAKYEVAVANEKAFVLENSKLKDKNIQYQFTVDQLKYFQDSILIKMEEVRKELKIKDKELKSLQYLLSSATKVDSIYVRDTIFKEPDFKLDTLIVDNWYTLNLGLEYPNKVIVNPTFKSEKYVITNYRKETVDPPKKCFIVRLFQKKHTLVEVTVVEKCPYINVEKQKFIEIIK